MENAENPDSRLVDAILLGIARRLREFYARVVNEPIPTSFVRLLRRLEHQAESPSTATRENEDL
jgi:hypothetical protein